MSEDSSRNAVRSRLLYLGGALLTSTLLFLGFIWPSIFTFVALLAAPSPVFFLIGVINPRFIQSQPLLRKYLIGCVCAAILSWAVEVVWLWSQGVEFVPE